MLPSIRSLEPLGLPADRSDKRDAETVTAPARLNYYGDVKECEPHYSHA
jgi:hypothetical protein